MSSTTLRQGGLRLGPPMAVLAAAVVAAVVAGPFVYIHFMTEEAPPAFRLAAVTENASASETTPTTTDGTNTTAATSTLDASGPSPAAPRRATGSRRCCSGRTPSPGDAPVR